MRLTLAILLVIGAVTCDVNVDSLFHGAPPPQAAPAQPAPGKEGEFATQGADVAIPNLDVFENFVPYASSRHDEFDWALTKGLLNSKTENTILSPFLVKLLLSILSEAAGVGTSTHRELQSILPSIKNESEARDLYGKAFGSLLQPSSNYKLNLGTKLYLDKFIQPNQRFASIIKADYFSDIENVEFSKAQEAANIINRWCSNKTENYIMNIVTPDDVTESVILLVNAIYFNGFWSQPFPENQTAPMNFHLDSKSGVSTPFMVNTGDYRYYESRELNSKILRLPYKGLKFAMYIVLPQDVEGINGLVDKIDSSTLHRAQYLLEEVEVKVALPKFRFTNSIQLNEILKELGIRQMFTNQASFPLLARGEAVKDRLRVSNVIQKTGIDVNEQGSTAYAATQVSLVNKFGGDYEFIADRPFLFLIEDETTGTLLFSGKVLNPTQT